MQNSLTTMLETDGVNGDKFDLLQTRHATTPDVAPRMLQECLFSESKSDSTTSKHWSSCCGTTAMAWVLFISMSVT